MNKRTRGKDDPLGALKLSWRKRVSAGNGSEKLLGNGAIHEAQELTCGLAEPNWVLLGERLQSKGVIPSSNGWKP